MNHTKKHQALKMFTAILFIIAFTAYAFPRWFGNGGQIAFDETWQEGVEVPMGDMIVDGAEYFLDSYVNIMSFLKESERAPNNALKPGLALLLGKAIKGMEMAHANFLRLKRLADVTAYDKTVIKALRKFDYDGFQATYGIDDPTFARVRHLLANGDIRSLYWDIVICSGELFLMLKQLKIQTDSGLFPSNWDVWKVERAYADLLRYGQYTARVFEALGIDG